jgi:4-aminobutyrate aminotransferase-like enzyme
MLHQGFILLPEGEHSNVISFSPPLTVSNSSLKQAVGALAATLAASARS